jgi:hypothetical protein
MTGRPVRSNPFGIEPALDNNILVLTRTTQSAMTEGDVIKPTSPDGPRGYCGVHANLTEIDLYGLCSGILNGASYGIWPFGKDHPLSTYFLVVSRSPELDHLSRLNLLVPATSSAAIVLVVLQGKTTRWHCQSWHWW